MHLAATPPNVARRITLLSLLAVVAAAGLATAARVVRRRRPRAKPVPVDRKWLSSSSRSR